MQRTLHIIVLAVIAVLSATLLSLRVGTRALLSRIPELDIYLTNHGHGTAFRLASLPNKVLSDAAPTASLSVSMIVAVIAALSIISAWPKKMKKVWQTVE